jgi:CTP synthase (UTP-ammonia lyase)
VTHASVAILGEYTPTFEPHAATNAAISHSATKLEVNVQATWVSTCDLDASLFEIHDGIWVAPGSPYKDLAKTVAAIRYAREHNVPCFGTCGGMQHIIIEYARNVLGFQDAQHAEYDPYASLLFVSELACSLAGREMQLWLQPGSQVAAIYGTSTVVERYYCNFGVHPDRVAALGAGPLHIVGSDAEGAVRVVELPGHPFFIGALYVPQSRSTSDAPHPLVSAFLRAAVAHRTTRVSSANEGHLARNVAPRHGIDGWS